MDEDRIALFLDYENLALGARDHLGGDFDLKPIADALAERGRVVTRRAYADWSYFDEDRRMLTRAHVELIEMPQRMGASRKNAADIKMAVDAVELAFERSYVTSFVICTGDSDFTPLVHKLRELNKRVIGVGVRGSTSAMLPPACDEFLFYDDLVGVEPPGTRTDRPAGRKSPARKGTGQAKSAEPEPRAGDEEVEAVTEPAEGGGDVAALVAQTVAGLQRNSGGPVTASVLKRTLVRKDSTFSEAEHGFRAFGELLRHLQSQGIVELSDGPAAGDPQVALPERGDRDEAFALLGSVVQEANGGVGVPLSGLKDLIRRRAPDFSEKKLGYSSFLQFCRAAATADVVSMKRSGDEYHLTAAPAITG